MTKTSLRAETPKTIEEFLAAIERNQDLRSRLISDIREASNELAKLDMAEDVLRMRFQTSLAERAKGTP